MVPGRPLRPVEPRRDGDGPRRRRPARRGRGAPTSGWPTSSVPTAAWHNYYRPDGTVEDAKLDTNVCAYIATGVWHHWLCTGTAASSTTCGRPSSGRSTGCCRCAAPTALVAVGRSRPTAPAVGLRPAHRLVEHRPRPALRRARSATLVGEPPPELGPRPPMQHAPTSIAHRPDALRAEGRAGRWTGTTRCSPARSTGERRPRPAWPRVGHVRDGGPGHPLRQRRAVGDRVGDRRVRARRTPPSATSTTATDLLRWTRAHRRHDGAYWTGIVYPTA